jgi:hypothetical protein
MCKHGFLVAWAAISCAGNPPVAQVPADRPAPAVAALSPASISLEKSPDSGNVDRVGTNDGALAPDGTNDLAFVARTDGPVSALFLVAVDAEGKPAGTFQADTLVGAAESPAELGAKPGNGTAGLGVFEDGKLLNGPDGNLQAVGAGTHSLTLYLAPSPLLTTGTRLRVYVQRPDKTLLAGDIVAN